MASDQRVLFEEFIDDCLRHRKLPDLESALAAGPSDEDLSKWNLTPDEWTIGLERAIAEFKDTGPRGV